MSISSPLLKELKGHILALTSPFGDTSPNAGSHYGIALPAGHKGNGYLTTQGSDSISLMPIGGSRPQTGASHSSSQQGPEASTETCQAPADIMSHTSRLPSPPSTVQTSSWFEATEQPAATIATQTQTFDTHSRVSSAASSQRPVFPSITDTHPALVPLCSTLEAILSDGLQDWQHTPFGYTKGHYWDWMSQQKDKTVGMYPSLVDRVARCKSVRTNTGRGRLLLRNTLVNSCMQVPVYYKGDVSAVYSPSSVLAHEILSVIFLSLVRQIDEMHFDLDLDKLHFLDDCWQLPLVRTVRLNTRLELGLHLGHVGGWCLVLRVEVGGVAHKTGAVHTGDVITSINDVSVRGRNRLRVATLVKQATAAAVTLDLTLAEGIDWRGRVYPPVLPLLQRLSVDVEEARDRRMEEHVDSVGGEQEVAAVTTVESDEDDRVLFLGAADIGGSGGIAFIDVGVMAVLHRQQHTDNRHSPVPVNFVTGEIGVRVTSVTGKVLLSHSYTEISACGRKDDCPLYFAYIAGDTTCSISDNFTCYVFKAPTETESSDILLTLADGFHRTHWTV